MKSVREKIQLRDGDYVPPTHNDTLEHTETGLLLQHHVSSSPFPDVMAIPSPQPLNYSQFGETIQVQTSVHNKTPEAPLLI